MRARAYPTWLTAGALLLYAVFIVLPGVLGIGYSFTDWNSYSNDLHWVGLDNFSKILSSGSTYLRFILTTVVFTVATIFLKTAIGLALALLLTTGRSPSFVSLPGDHLPASGPPDPGHQPHLPLGAQPRHRSAQRNVAGRRPGRPRAALADRPIHRAVERHRGRHVARRRLYHGHPHRGPDGDPGGVLRSCRHRRRVGLACVPVHHAADARAGPDGHDRAQPAVRPQGLRRRVRAHERRARAGDRHGVHGGVR